MACPESVPPVLLLLCSPAALPFRPDFCCGLRLRVLHLCCLLRVRGPQCAFQADLKVHCRSSSRKGATACPGAGQRARHRRHDPPGRRGGGGDEAGHSGEGDADAVARRRPRPVQVTPAAAACLCHHSSTMPHAAPLSGALPMERPPFVTIWLLISGLPTWACFKGKLLQAHVTHFAVVMFRETQQ